MSYIKLFRVLIFVLLVAISLPVVYGEDNNIGEGLFVDGEGYMGPNPEDEIDYASISSGGSSEDDIDINSTDMIVDMVAIYAEECKENLNWDVGLFVDDLLDRFEDAQFEF